MSDQRAGGMRAEEVVVGFMKERRTKRLYLDAKDLALAFRRAGFTEAAGRIEEFIDEHD